MRFSKWLETVAVDDRPTVSIGGGNTDIPNDNDGDDDDDFENGPWGWNKLTKINLALHNWAKSSDDVKKIKDLLCQRLFEKPAKEDIRVFPNFVQIEVEWLMEIKKWNDLDDIIEAILKRSDLWKPLRIRQEELWNIVEKGAVYDYAYYVILMYLTGRGFNLGERSVLDNTAAFVMYNYLREDWSTLEKTIKWNIESQYWPRDKKLEIELDTNGRSFSKPVGISQATNYGERLWAKGIAQVPYRINNPQNARFIDQEED